LQQLGAKLAISENLEASLDLAREALARGHVTTDQSEALLRRFRERYYGKCEAGSEGEPPGSSSS
jgi:hypothetical protein